MAEERRPALDLSSLSTFAFPAAKPKESTKATRIYSGGSHHQHNAPIPNIEAPRVSDDEMSVDLTKYGPPDALAKLNQSVPATVITVIEKSIDTVRAQVETEQKLRRRHEEAERSQSAREKGQHRTEDDSRRQPGKGRNVGAPRDIRVSVPESSPASDQTDTLLFYTPSEGQTPSASTESDAGMEALTATPTAADNDLDLTPTLRPKSLSASATPKRRDLIKAVFRKMSDSETRRQAIRRSVGALQLKAKLKHAKKMWYRFVSFTTSLRCLL